MIKGAIIDSTGQFRYSLWRIWDENKPLAVFIMLNPSTADAEEDDPTIRRCMNYARSWGYGGIKVVNLFAYRATNPKELEKVEDPIGPKNNDYLIKETNALNVGVVVVAWGAKIPRPCAEENALYHLISVKNLCYLELSKEGHPKHPLYLRADLKPKKLVI